jgi:hypothetical protein
VTSRDFCFWLQGCFEMAKPGQEPAVQGFTADQALLIKKHLALVFLHEIDPAAGPPAHQEKLNEVHEGVNPFVAPSLVSPIDLKPKPSPLRPTGGGVMRC